MAIDGESCIDMTPDYHFLSLLWTIDCCLNIVGSHMIAALEISRVFHGRCSNVGFSLRYGAVENGSCAVPDDGDEPLAGSLAGMRRWIEAGLVSLPNVQYSGQLKMWLPTLPFLPGP
jgi:hypothetical protein